MWIAGWTTIRRPTRSSSAVSPRGKSPRRARVYASISRRAAYLVLIHSVDKAKSTVVLTATGVDFDLYLPANKRCIKRVDLYNDIDVEGSDYKILGTKVSC